MATYNHTKWQRVFGSPSDSVVLNPAAGPAFNLVSRPGATVSLIENQVFTAAMELARAALDRAILLLDARIPGAAAPPLPANFENLADYCFWPGNIEPLRTNRLATVRANVQRIRVGLTSAGLQIVDSNPNRGGAASGYVRTTVGEALRPGTDPATEKPFVGRIHVRFATVNTGNTPVNQQMAAFTIVHEASHRFCGTRDWGYNGGGSAGYFALLALGPAAIPHLATDQALNNADSYAEFVMRMP